MGQVQQFFKDNPLSSNTDPTPDPSPSPSASDCHTLDHTKAVPQGFGASYSTIAGNNQLLLNASCTGSDTTLTVGNGNNTTYIWNTAYIWENSKWNALTISCANNQSSWCVGTGTVHTTLSQTTTPTYYAAFVCQWQNSKWNCGCRDQSCTQGYWQLQGIKP